MSPAVEKICWIWENGTVKLKNQSDSSVLSANFRFSGLDIYGKTLTGKSSQKALKPAWNRHKLGGHLFCHTEMSHCYEIDTLKIGAILFLKILLNISRFIFNFSFSLQNKKWFFLGCLSRKVAVKDFCRRTLPICFHFIGFSESSACSNLFLRSLWESCHIPVFLWFSVNCPRQGNFEILFW